MLGVGFYMLPMARTFHTSQNLGSWRLVPAAVLLASALQSAGLRASQVVTAVHQVTQLQLPSATALPLPSNAGDDIDHIPRQERAARHAACDQP